MTFNEDINNEATEKARIFVEVKVLKGEEADEFALDRYIHSDLFLLNIVSGDKVDGIRKRKKMIGPSFHSKVLDLSFPFK